MVLSAHQSLYNFQLIQIQIRRNYTLSICDLSKKHFTYLWFKALYPFKVSSVCLLLPTSIKNRNKFIF